MHLLSNIIDEIAREYNGISFLGEHHINARLNLLGITKASAVYITDLDQFKAMKRGGKPFYTNRVFYHSILGTASENAM